MTQSLFKIFKLLARSSFLSICLLTPLFVHAQSRVTTQIESLIGEAERDIQQAEYQQALSSLTLAYDLSRSEGDDELTRNVLNSIANAYYSIGWLDQAERYYSELVAHDNNQRNWQLLSVSLFNLAHVYASNQQFALAQTNFERSLSLSIAEGDESGSAFTLKALGVNAHAQGNNLSARNFLNQALQKFEILANDGQIASVLRNLGDVEESSGEYDQAVAYYLEALPVLSMMSLDDALLRAYRGLSNSYEQMFDYELAFVAHRAFTQLLQQQLQQENLETTRLLQVQFDTQRFADENDRLAIVDRNRILELEQRDHEIEKKNLYIVLGLCVILCALISLAISQRYGRQMKLLATTDELTGLLNRRAIMNFALNEWHRSARFKRPLSCLMFDIDHFKSINDTYGHNIGDLVLVAISKELQSTLRQTDALGRFGGEEFLLIATETELDKIKILAERIRQKIEALVYAEMDGRTVTVSIGLAQLADEASLEDLIKHADQALYHSKGAGRNQVTVFSPEEEWSLMPAV